MNNKSGRLKGFVGGFDAGVIVIEEGDMCFAADVDC